MARYERKDAFHQRAKREGYRSRAAYKLLELDRAHGVLRRGARVADLGCWPGGWMQVAARKVGPQGRVVGIDLAPLDPPLDLANAVAFTGDLREAVPLDRLVEALGGRADVVLSDAAPKLTGVKATDRAREEGLLEAIDQALPRILAPGGTLLAKRFDAPEAVAWEKRMRSQFASVKVVRPKASRKGSSEKYLLAKGYRGAEEAGSA
ncbi:MAG: RlmE family RNA methyltransferase [Myxococcota bacterium]|nr:RlmE family RNA methyltransferase [Myxococcota bacterium]